MCISRGRHRVLDLVGFWRLPPAATASRRTPRCAPPWCQAFTEMQGTRPRHLTGARTLQLTINYSHSIVPDSVPGLAGTSRDSTSEEEEQQGLVAAAATTEQEQRLVDCIDRRLRLGTAAKRIALAELYNERFAEIILRMLGAADEFSGAADETVPLQEHELQAHFLGKILRMFKRDDEGLDGTDIKSIDGAIARFTLPDLPTNAALHMIPFLAFSGIFDMCANWASAALPLMLAALIHQVKLLDHVLRPTPILLMPRLSTPPGHIPHARDLRAFCQTGVSSLAAAPGPSPPRSPRTHPHAELSPCQRLQGWPC